MSILDLFRRDPMRDWPECRPVPLVFDFALRELNGIAAGAPLERLRELGRPAGHRPLSPHSHAAYFPPLGLEIEHDGHFVGSFACLFQPRTGNPRAGERAAFRPCEIVLRRADGATGRITAGTTLEEIRKHMGGTVHRDQDGSMLRVMAGGVWLYFDFGPDGRLRVLDIEPDPYPEAEPEPEGPGPSPDEDPGGSASAHPLPDASVPTFGLFRRDPARDWPECRPVLLVYDAARRELNGIPLGGPADRLRALGRPANSRPTWDGVFGYPRLGIEVHLWAEIVESVSCVFRPGSGDTAIEEHPEFRPCEIELHVGGGERVLITAETGRAEVEQWFGPLAAEQGEHGTAEGVRVDGVWLGFEFDPEGRLCVFDIEPESPGVS